MAIEAGEYLRHAEGVDICFVIAIPDHSGLAGGEVHPHQIRHSILLVRIYDGISTGVEGVSKTIIHNEAFTCLAVIHTQRSGIAGEMTVIIRMFGRFFHVVRGKIAEVAANLGVVIMGKVRIEDGENQGGILLGIQLAQSLSWGIVIKEAAEVVIFLGIFGENGISGGYRFRQDCPFLSLDVHPGYLAIPDGCKVISIAG